MAIRVVLQKEDEILRKRCKEVKIFDENLWTILDDMRETLVKEDGVGLAAPQVGILKRVVIIDVNHMQMELINPKIIDQDGEEIEQEACLSCKGMSGYVKRPYQVTVSAYDRYGNEFYITGIGLLARCLCHEIDHLDGVLYIDKVIPNYKPKHRD